MMPYLLSALSGLLLALGFPKFNLFWLVWFALVPLFYALRGAVSPRQAGWLGFITGLVFNGITFLFIFTLGEWVGGFIFLGWLVLTVFLALYTALFAYLLKKINNFIFAPFLWVLMEWLRSLGPFGVVPSLGYSQWPWLEVIQLASFTGVIGISFMLVLGNVVIFRMRERRVAFVLFLLLLAVVYGFGWQALHAQRLALGRSAVVALIQGNHSQTEKLDYSNLPAIKKTYYELTEQSLSAKPQIIVWPETSIPFYIQSDAAYLASLEQLAKNNGVELVLGLPRRDGAGNAYNSALFISASAEVIGWQDKHNLVPFGEYLPLRALLIPFLKNIKALQYTILLEQDFTQSRLVAPVATPRGKIGIGICSDSFFPSIFREYDHQGVDFYFIISNDSWYKDSSGPYKHLVADIFRAVECGKYIAHCGNTGISCFIDPWGRVLQQSTLDERLILQGTVYSIQRHTFYSQYGDWFVYVCLLVGLLGIRYRKIDF